VAQQKETEWATVGKVVAPFGVHGELKVRSLSDIPDRFTELEVVYLGPVHVPHRIISARPSKGDMMVLKLSDIDDANTAEAVRNCDIAIPISQLAELPSDSYYQHDIIGLRVYTLDGRFLGKIVDIMPTGSNDVYIIEAAADNKQLLIPAIKDVIKQVDLSRQMMYIEAIQGLLDNDDTTNSDEEEDA
jgi:16S rRNA processing protein RimM